MEQLQKQVRIARRRLNGQRLLEVLPWTLLAGLVVALIAVVARKIWYFPVDGQIWFWSWTGGGLAVGLIAATVVTWLKSDRDLQAAMEIDRRFGLRERISSVLALGPSERDTAVGEALTSDAVKRINNIDVRDKFGLKAPWPSALPLLPAIAVFLLLLLGDATPNKAQASPNLDAEQQKAIKAAADELKKRIEKQQKRLADKGLEDAANLLEQLKEGADSISKDNDVTKKDAMIKLNDLAKALEKRREELGGADEMKKQFQQMGDIENGPADKLNKALKNGDLGKALEAADQLKKQLESGNLSKEEKEQLAKQLNQLKEQVQKQQQARQQAMEDLQRQIEQKMAQGDTAAAAQLQQQLDKMQAMDGKMQKMQQLADKLGKAAQQMQQGNSQQAAEQLEDVMSDLQDLRDQLDELAEMDDAMSQLGDCKNNCNGSSFPSLSGMQGQNPGQGMGDGQGQGARPIEEDDTGDYLSRVRGNLGKGKAVRVGDADGKNVAGRTREQAAEAVQASLSEKSDPLTDQRLPREQRDHVREYFKRYINEDE